MPLNELESHPYLNNQVGDFRSKTSLKNFCKLIVGTFPIYAITDSIPVEIQGSQKRLHWQNEAFMQYFYGSHGSCFWELIANSFEEEIPTNREEAIRILNKYNILISDAIRSAYREEYSSADAALNVVDLNQSLVDLLDNAENLKIIYFTSIEAKKKFYAIMGINFRNTIDTNRDMIAVVNNKNYRMIILMTPAGNARSAWSYRHNFPLSQIEVNNRAIGIGYALGYRKRYYKHYLTLPCK